MTVIMGKPIGERPIPLSDAMEEEIQVTVWGDVFQTDKHVTRDETKVIYKILFTDYTNSFALKTIVSAEKAHLIDDTLKPGKTILTSGKVMLDTFEKELLLRPDSIALVKRTYRQDTSEKKRVELHLHTNMSSMDGMTPADKLVQRAAYFGHTARCHHRPWCGPGLPRCHECPEGGGKVGQGDENPLRRGGLSGQ